MNNNYQVLKDHKCKPSLIQVGARTLKFLLLFNEGLVNVYFTVSKASVYFPLFPLLDVPMVILA